MRIVAAPKLTLAAAKISAKTKINVHRDGLAQGGIIFNGSPFQTDATALSNLSYWHIQILSGAVLPENFVWRDANNLDHPADSNFIKDLSLAITERNTQLYSASWVNKDNIEALTSVPAVEAFEAVWPS